ncbi:MAG: hypothetical protein O3B21_14440 [Proteobacteria bacterium]|nr:hypothetical protein [Pseudomonadota bacterium]MDA1357268.1 hypothetical protein [Pseudomonadota bacterium]
MNALMPLAGTIALLGEYRRVTESQFFDIGGLEAQISTSSENLDRLQSPHKGKTDA